MSDRMKRSRENSSRIKCGMLVPDPGRMCHLLSFSLSVRFLLTSPPFLFVLPLHFSVVTHSPPLIFPNWIRVGNGFGFCFSSAELCARCRLDVTWWDSIAESRSLRPLCG